MRSGHGEQDDITGVIEVFAEQPEPVTKALWDWMDDPGGLDFIVFLNRRGWTCVPMEQVQCTVCERWFVKDDRGDVLDSSGRCDECRP